MTRFFLCAGLAVLLAACQTGKMSDSFTRIEENERRVSFAPEMEKDAIRWTAKADGFSLQELIVLSGDDYAGAIFSGQLIRNRVWRETADEIGFKKLMGYFPDTRGKSLTLGARMEGFEGIGVVRAWSFTLGSGRYRQCIGSIDNWGSSAGKASEFSNRVYNYICADDRTTANARFNKFKNSLDVRPRFYNGTGIKPTE